jgi:hypothetical protein
VIACAGDRQNCGAARCARAEYVDPADPAVAELGRKIERSNRALCMTRNGHGARD